MTISFRILTTLAFVVSIAIVKHAATAMEFSVKQLSDGDQFVLAKGEIVVGDAERLRVALGSLGRNRYGNKEIALESGGGLVAEAFKMVALMDQEKVSTFVLSGAACASACAQILFLAGVHRIVADGGRLGMHTCAAGGDRSELCNEKIAQNAFEHGTDHGSVMTFMTYTGPHQMIWFGSKEADCYGFTLYPPEIKRGKKPGEIAPCVLEAIRQPDKIDFAWPRREQAIRTYERLQCPRWGSKSEAKVRSTLSTADMGGPLVSKRLA